MSWTSQQVDCLIEEYSKYPLLYVIKHRNYHNKRKRIEAMHNIAGELNRTVRPNTTEVDALKKWNGLRSTYNVERKKVLDSMAIALTADDIYKPSLWYYDKMEFINDNMNTRPAKANFELPFTNGDDDNYVLNIKVEDSLMSMPESSDGNSRLTPNLNVDEDPLPPISGGPGPSGVKRLASPEPVVNHYFSQNMKNDAEDSCCATFALNTMPATVARVGSNERAEDDIFGEYVSVRLKSIKNKKRKLKVCNQIDNLLFEAQMNDDTT